VDDPAVVALRTRRQRDTQPAPRTGSPCTRGASRATIPREAGECAPDDQRLETNEGSEIAASGGRESPRPLSGDQRARTSRRRGRCAAGGLMRSRWVGRASGDRDRDCGGCGRARRCSGRRRRRLGGGRGTRRGRMGGRSDVLGHGRGRRPRREQRVALSVRERDELQGIRGSAPRTRAGEDLGESDPGPHDETLVQPGRDRPGDDDLRRLDNLRREILYGDQQREISPKSAATWKATRSTARSREAPRST
jgi:hypothetical protein